MPLFSGRILPAGVRRFPEECAFEAVRRSSVTETYGWVLTKISSLIAHWHQPVHLENRFNRALAIFSATIASPSGRR